MALKQGIVRIEVSQKMHAYLEKLRSNEANRVIPDDRMRDLLSLPIAVSEHLSGTQWRALSSTGEVLFDGGSVQAGEAAG